MLLLSSTLTPLHHFPYVTNMAFVEFVKYLLFYTPVLARFECKNSTQHCCTYVMCEYILHAYAVEILSIQYKSIQFGTHPMRLHQYYLCFVSFCAHWLLACLGRSPGYMGTFFAISDFQLVILKMDYVYKLVTKKQTKIDGGLTG